MGFGILGRMVFGGFATSSDEQAPYVFEMGFDSRVVRLYRRVRNNEIFQLTG